MNQQHQQQQQNRPPPSQQYLNNTINARPAQGPIRPTRPQSQQQLLQNNYMTASAFARPSLSSRPAAVSNFSEGNPQRAAAIPTQHQPLIGVPMGRPIITSSTSNQSQPQQPHHLQTPQYSNYGNNNQINYNYNNQPSNASFTSASPSLPQQQQQSQPQQAQPQTFQFTSPSTSSTTFQVLGTTALSMGSELVSKNVSTWYNPVVGCFELLRTYFDIDNAFVLRKILLVLFPFRNKNWARSAFRNDVTGSLEGYKTPKEDINSPDLYIPIMSLVSYVLLVSFITGLTGSKNTAAASFKPSELLSVTATTAALFSFIEAGTIWLGCYLLNIGREARFLDVIAIVGYKYIGLVATALFSLCIPSSFGSVLIYVFFSYCLISMAFFFLRSLRHLILSDTSSGSLHMQQRRRRVHFLFGVALLQILFSYVILVISVE